MARKSDRPTSPAASAERRQYQRTTLQSPALATLASEEVMVLNVSEGGVMVHATVPAAEGSIHRLSAEVGNDTLELWVRVVHCVRLTVRGEARYMLNIAFVSAPDAGQLEILRRWQNGG